MFMSTDTHIKTKHVSVCLSVCLFVCLSVCLSVCTDTRWQKHISCVSQVLSICTVASAHCVCVIVNLLTVYMQLLVCGPSADKFWLADGRIFFFSFCMFMFCKEYICGARQHTVFAMQMTWSLWSCSCWHLALSRRVSAS